MEAYFMTDIGKVRSHNEDSGGIFYNKANQLLAIIADGMGGHSGGEIASELATNFIQQAWESADEFQKANDVEKWITETVATANKVILTESQEKENLEGMGTTLVLTACTDEFVTIAHIGDSRCYLQTDDQIKQMTEDHSLVNELLRSGQITEDDAQYHPRKNVLLRALGTEETIETEIQTIMWEQNSKLLLCSDGLSNKIEEEELKAFLSKDEQLEQIAAQLIELANERGGEDNISIAIVQLGDSARVGETE